MQQTIKLLQCIRDGRDVVLIDNDEIDEAITESKFAELAINETKFVLEMLREIDQYLKKGTIIILPENISAESELTALLESRDDLSWYDADKLKSQIADVQDAVNKLSGNE